MMIDALANYWRSEEIKVNFESSYYIIGVIKKKPTAETGINC